MCATTDLLKNKSRPETAAHEAAAWVESERALREKLKKEREARELKEKQEVSYPIQIDYHHSFLFGKPSSLPLSGIQYAHLRRPQREQRKQELLQKEKEAAELKKLEEAEAARKAAEQAAALLLQSSAHVALSMDAMPAPVPVPENEQVAQVVEAEADKENTTADAPAEDDASTDSEDERGDDQVASAPDARTVWVSVGQDAST